MLSIETKVNQYVKNGSSIFVYSLIGDKKDLEAYKVSQGVNYREDETTKKPLYFSQRVCNAGDVLNATKGGRYQVYQDLESKDAQLQTAIIGNLGKLEAVRQLSGLSKAQFTERLLASM